MAAEFCRWSRLRSGTCILAMSFGEVQQILQSSAKAIGKVYAEAELPEASARRPSAQVFSARGVLETCETIALFGVKFSTLCRSNTGTTVKRHFTFRCWSGIMRR